VYDPLETSRGTTRRRTIGEIANPTFTPFVARFTPTTVPFRESSGPPLFPGLIAALVWTVPGIVKECLVGIVRFTPLTTPVVIEPVSPKGFPMAATGCPGRGSVRAIGRGRAAAGRSGTRTTARSEYASLPITLACSHRPLWNWTSTAFAFSITWWFVTTSPFAS